jgi:hypothetical protein
MIRTRDPPDWYVLGVAHADRPGDAGRDDLRGTLAGPGFYAELAAFRSVMTVPPKCRLTAWAPEVVAVESWSIVLAARKLECGWFLR